MSSEAASSPGTPERLGDFRLIERLGAGGMGVVYVARQQSLQRDVALKLILPEHLYFAEARERFRREVESAAKLRHPGIVPIYTVGEEGGLPYFAMELIDGAPLASVIEHLRARGPIDLTGDDLRREIQASGRSFGGAPSSGFDGSTFSGTWVQACCRVVLQVAEALHHAHERGVLHRDVKPSNVVLTPSGRAMLFDFGLASSTDSSRITRTGAQIGSLPYMPPECLRRGTLVADRRADVYSLGVSMYELLALRLPFEGATIQEVYAGISSGEARPLRELNPSVPSDAAVVCATAMERDLERRYPSAEAFARDLRNLLELRPIEAQPPTRATRVRRWVQRHPTRSVALALGFLLVVVAPSVAWWRIRAERDLALRDLQAKEGILDFVMGLFDAADPNRGNPGERSVYALVDEGAARIQTAFPDHPEVRGQLMLDLAGIQGNLGREREAVELGRGALALLRAFHGEDGEIVVLAKHELAVQLIKRGEVGEAQQLIDEIRDVYQRAGSQGTLALFRLELDSAAAMIVQGRVDDAEIVLRRAAVAPTWQSLAQPGDRLAWTTHMSQVHRRRGELELAEHDCAAAVDLARQTYGSAHAEVARTLQNLAEILGERGRLEDALPLYDEADQIRARLDAGESLDDARLLYNVGVLYGKLGRQAESAEHFGRALEMCRRLAGDSQQTASAAAGMGMALYKAGEYEKAETILREALDLSRRFIPRLGRAAADAPLLLARCLVKLERLDEAALLYQEALQCIDGDAGVPFDLAAKWEGEFGALLQTLGRSTEAEVHLERQRKLLEATPKSAQ